MPLIFDPGQAYQFDWSHEYAILSGVTTRVKGAHIVFDNTHAMGNAAGFEGRTRRSLAVPAGKGRAEAPECVAGC